MSGNIDGIINQVSTAVAATVENVEAGAAAAIEEANRRAENAEAAAAAIADGALQREISARIDNLYSDYQTWQGDHESVHSNLNSQIQALQAQTAEMLERLSQATQVQIVTREPATPDQSTPQPSQQTTVTTINPANADAGDLQAVVADNRPRGPRLI